MSYMALTTRDKIEIKRVTGNWGKHLWLKQWFCIHKWKKTSYSASDKSRGHHTCIKCGLGKETNG